ncbi:MAG TPA: hypothetical protein VIX35_00870, partial [Vicinamibacterales bacterium]
METVRFGGRAVQGFGVGKVLDVWTVEDLDKLIKNKDVEMAAMAKQVAVSTDPSIKADWATLNQAYQVARTAGLQAVTDGRSFLVPDSVATGHITLSGKYLTDKAYTDIIAALQPVEHQVTPGSKQDIGNRLMNAGWKPDYKLPFQTQSDADLTFYKDTAKLDLLAEIEAWVAKHKTAIIVSVSVVGGVVVLGVLSPYARMVTAALPHRRA